MMDSNTFFVVRRAIVLNGTVRNPGEIVSRCCVPSEALSKLLSIGAIERARHKLLSDVSDGTDNAHVIIVSDSCIPQAFIAGPMETKCKAR